MAKILLMLKETVLNEVPLEKGMLTIGRNAENDIVLDNLAVSGAHAKLILEKGRYVIEDLQSTNGTFVSGRKIGRQMLSHDDKIAIGKYTLVFVAPPQDAGDDDATIVIRRTPVSQDKTLVVDVKSGAPPQSSPARIGGFLVVGGKSDEKEYELTDKLTTIGKIEGAKIRLKGFFAPKVGALVNRVNDSFFISPPGSGKKPKVNGKVVEGRCELHDGDVVEVGKLMLQFYVK